MFLSFSDSDLLCLDAAHTAEDAPAASLRSANLSCLLHPMSIDLYVADTIMESRCVVVRLLGGLEYWRYGAEELARACQQARIPLAFVAGDGRDDPRLARLSTVTEPIRARLDALLRAGGTTNTATALRLMAHLAGCGPDENTPPEPLPPAGLLQVADAALPLRALVVFYRAHLLAADIDPIMALADTLARYGMGADLLYVTSLKDAASVRILTARLAAAPPDVIINATFFSARAGWITPPRSTLRACRYCRCSSPALPITCGVTACAACRRPTLPCRSCYPNWTGGFPPSPFPSRKKPHPACPRAMYPCAGHRHDLCARGRLGTAGP